MSVRKRTWKTRNGDQKECWIVDYTDQSGKRHIQTFERKKDADDCQATIKVEVGKGIHTAHSKSLTVAEAAENWIKYVELEGRERTTVVQYRHHVENHINPRIGREKLAKLTTPRIQAFRDDLLAALSRAQAKKVLTSFKSLLKDAQRRGQCGAERRTWRFDQTRQSRQIKVEGRRRYSDARRDQAHHPCSDRPAAAAADRGDIHRVAEFRTARPALGRC